MYKGLQVIAEVKTESPFGYKSDKSWEELFAIACQVGDIISVHTDLRWGGSFELLQKARAMTAKPILAKGIHVNDAEIARALMVGADWVLVVGRVPEKYLKKCFIEPNTLDELRALPQGVRAVWNSRDLATGGLKTETFEQAREIFNGWLCQASNIRTVANSNLGADAVLVGTHLIEFARSLRRDGVV